jgi:hypothetical protein
MATIKTKADLLTSIAADLADNNAGDISAEDVRHNLEDTVASINLVVASGDTNTTNPFTQDVRVQVQDPGGSPTGGSLIVESGIMFPNAVVNSGARQVEPWLGVANIDHRDLGNLGDGDPHTQYVPISGARPMTGNLQVGVYWIGASGDNSGLKFDPNPAGGTDITVSGEFQYPDSSVNNSARGVAKAYLHFNAGGSGVPPTVSSSYNITELEDLDVGKFRIKFASGVLGDDYIAIGSSNATSTSGNMEDFDVNTVGLVSRSGVDPNRTITFVVRNDAGEYVDAEINELVVYSDGPGVSTDSVTII